MNKIKKIIGLFLSFVLILSLAIPMNVEAASKVKINKTKATMYIGNSETLKISGTSKKVTWTSSNKKVATVNSKGKVTPKKKGTTTITAKVSGKKYTCKVTVKKPYINTTKKTIYVGSTYTLKLTGTDIKAVKTSNSKVAIVNKKGKITAKKAGTAKITLIGKDKKKYTCTITVKKPSINESKVTLNVGETYDLELIGTSIKSVSSSNSDVASISNKGKVTAKKAGTASVTLKGKDGKKYTCKVTVNETHEHSYTSKVTKEATCASKGVKTYTCSCGDSYTEDIPKTSSHTWDTGKVTSKATCSQEGEKTYSCIVCGTTKNESINATGHSYSDTVIAPSCTNKGYTTHTCSKCGDSYKDAYTNAIEHTASEWIIDKQATCTENGSKHKECTICQIILEKEVITDGHSYDVGVVTKEPNCTGEGKKTYTCSKCGATKNESINAAGHSYNETVVEPTCTNKGYTTHTCSKCGDSYNDAYTNTVEHTESEWLIDKKATCTENGSKHKECTICHTTIKKEAIKATGHTYGHFVETLAPADFETFGAANMVCPTCNETLFSDLTAVKVDLGDGNSETMYGYYDYDEAKECFDLTLEYIKTHSTTFTTIETDDEGNVIFDENGKPKKISVTVPCYDEEKGFIWNEDKYNYACIRTAEMAYQFESTGAANHKRPNGSSLGCGENLLYSGPKYIGVNLQLKDISASEALQRWLESSGHKDNIEGGYGRMASAQFKAWIPSKEGWAIFWVQNFY